MLAHVWLLERHVWRWFWTISEKASGGESQSGARGHYSPEAPELWMALFQEPEDDGTRQLESGDSSWSLGMESAVYFI